MAGTSRPSSSTNPPMGSQTMPRKIRDSIEQLESEIQEILAQFKRKETEKRDLQKSIVDNKATVRSINKEIRIAERKVNAIDEEFTMIDEELRDKYSLVAHLKGLYPEDP